MKKILKFIGILIGIFIWIETINLAFYLMTKANTFYFYGGLLMLALLCVTPIFYFADHIIKFLSRKK
jgi:hypothetical protein